MSVHYIELRLNHISEGTPPAGELVILFDGNGEWETGRYSPGDPGWWELRDEFETTNDLLKWPWWAEVNALNL